MVKEADSHVVMWVVKLNGDREARSFGAKILLQATSEELSVPVSCSHLSLEFCRLVRLN